MPEPSPNAYMSTRFVGTPSALAIGRFWVTPRTKSPRRVRVSSSEIRTTTAAAKKMIAMRFHGSTRLGMSSIPPDIQFGFSTCTFCAPNSVRIDWIRMRLIPQVASSVSSGRPYRKRITLRSIAMPTTADAAKATGMAATR